MIYRGVIKNGVAVLDTPGALPDGTQARVEAEPVASESWCNKSVEELAREQKVKPIGALADLTMDWPADESVDEFLALVREVRH